MADIAKALVYKVTHDAGVIALIVDRFYDMRLPQGVTLPAATYQIISGGRLSHLHKESSALPHPRIQISCWGTMGTHDIAAIDRAIKVAIDGKRESWGIAPYITEVQRCVAETTSIEGLDLDSGLYYLMRDYLIMYKE